MAMKKIPKRCPSCKGKLIKLATPFEREDFIIFLECANKKKALKECSYVLGVKKELARKFQLDWEREHGRN
jgi:hypothetical protein